jgi:RNA-binding protein
MNTARRSELRAKAHDLSPVVIIGDKGLTDTVVAEIDRALKAHELIKVKAATDDREARAAWMGEICSRLGADPVQSIGKILVIWRKNPEEAAPKKAPATKAPPKKKATAGKPPFQRGKQASAEGVTRSVRPRSPAPSPPRESGPLRRRPRTSR